MEKLYQYMKYKCCVPCLPFIFAGMYIQYIYYNREHIFDMKHKKIPNIKSVHKKNREGERERGVQEKGQNTHYIMHTQYLARKNH